jgi:hypothetical protein
MALVSSNKTAFGSRASAFGQANPKNPAFGPRASARGRGFGIGAGPGGLEIRERAGKRETRVQRET